MSREHRLHKLSQEEVHKMLRKFGYVTHGQADDIALVIDIMQQTGADAEKAMELFRKMDEE